MQGLLTNDVGALTPNTGCYAAMLNAQGRMLTDMRVLELKGSMLVELPAGVTAAIRDHLERFVFSEDVQVEDVSATLAQVGVYGPDAARLAGSLTGTDVASLMPLASIEIDRAGTPLVVAGSDEFGIPGYEMFVSGGAVEALKDDLRAAGARDATPVDLETVRIEGGVPHFGTDMDTETIPLEAGLDRAISRTKGCYVGQEVIVRVIDRGHGRVARRLVGLVLAAGDGVPAPGTPITAGDRDIGRVTSAVRSPALERPIALGYVHRDFTSPGTSVTISGVPAVVTDLPFVRD